MNIDLAIAIVKDHIRIGNALGMEGYEVPEALEMVVEELEVTQRALDIACKSDSDFFLSSDKAKEYYLAQAKAGDK